jgi:glycosyltransferase involved in cell wall biosynthesis
VSAAKLRVLFFTPWLGGGGAELHLVRVMNALPVARFDVASVSARGSGSYETQLAPHVRLHAALTSGVRSATASTLGAVFSLRALVRRERPDVLCSALEHANMAALGATAMLPHRPRRVLCVQADPRMAFAGRSVDAILTRHALRRFYHHADCIVALSQGVRAALSELDPRVDRITEVIHNAAVDERVRAGAAAPASRVDLPPGSRLLVACGRLHPQKDYPTLFLALRRLRASVAAVLWVLGEGAERPRLQALASELGIADAVRFLGFQPNPWSFMAAADVFVLSSRYEGFGNVLAEAMACGAPVVATDCPSGPSEVLDGGRAGVLVPPGQPTALFEALRRVLLEPGLAGRLREQGSRRARAFQSDAIATRYGELFERVAASPQRAGAVQ